MSAGIRERVALRLHSERCHWPGCDNTPEDIDYEDADAVLAEVRAWLGSAGVREAVETAFLGRTATTGAKHALAALIDQTKEAP